ncbi:MAG: DUF3108 domain-containing protein [Candidatus Dadabacteria bacterium]|nr:MAG: DUF3108 domain-containing protein [Candidatus Dadabacteria bacterium]
MRTPRDKTKICRAGRRDRHRERCIGHVLARPAVLFACLVLHILSAACAGAFNVPETLRYDLVWTGVKAGEATLEVRSDGTGLRITSIANSARWVSFFFKVNDKIESVLRSNPEQLPGRPVAYRVNLSEGRYRRHKEVVFDHETLRAVYIDHIRNERAETDVPSRFFDPLSSFYHLRYMDLKAGRSVHVPVFDNKKVSEVEVLVLRNERVTVPAGSFDTILVKPLMKSEGIFASRGEIYIWLTDDERRIPVRLKIKVRIGSVIANLAGGTY